MPIYAEVALFYLFQKYVDNIYYLYIINELHNIHITDMYNKYILYILL